MHIEFQQITQPSLSKLMVLVRTLLKVLINYLDIFYKLKITAIVNIPSKKIELGKQELYLGQPLCLSLSSHIEEVTL